MKGKLIVIEGTDGSGKATQSKLLKEKLEKECLPKIAHGVINARNGDVEVVPGYDGVFGKVNVYKKEEKEEKQMEFFCI